MENAQQIRIVTTVGHVDHGKTTLMDALLAANNIISTRMAGKLRYLDSREDEQERGITMESSAVSLKFQVVERGDNGESFQKTYVVNMVDTPGHVDFSFEVSTAARLCDGALVLVDVVEGVCTQTVTVLRQCWQDKLRPILVVNKLDRLVMELKLSPMEAHKHLTRLIEQVNAVMGTFFTGDRMQDDLRWREERERNAVSVDAGDDEFQEKDDQDIYFAPDRGNVVFASAIDGWGFRVGKFAQLYALKLGIEEWKLRKVLWGDFYFDPKTKKVIGSKHLRGRALKPLFVQFVLENIWAVYDATVVNPNPEKVSKIVTALNLKIHPRDLKSKDTRHLLSVIFSQWLPLSTCIIQTIIDVVPAPPVAQATRIRGMLDNEAALKPNSRVEEDLFTANSQPSASVLAYVSKMFAVPSGVLSEKKVPRAEEARRGPRDTRTVERVRSETIDDGKVIPSSPAPSSSETKGIAAGEQDEVILGFARLYSGVIRTGSTLYCVLPKYDTSLGPTHPSNAQHFVTTPVEGLFVMMGRELVPVDFVRAGNIFAIRGLEGRVWRSATLCGPTETGIEKGSVNAAAKDYILNLAGMSHAITPIVRVAVEPKTPGDLPKLLNGLKLLSQSDPCVRTFQQPSGEHVIVAAGELHLERCLKDLRDRFARVEIHPSKPIVPFRETAIKAPDMASPKTSGAHRGTIKGASSPNVVTFTIRCLPFPKDIVQFILDNATALQILQRDLKNVNLQNGDPEAYEELLRQSSVKPEEFWDTLETKGQQAGGDWEDIANQVWAFGPGKTGACILADARKPRPTQSLRRGRGQIPADRVETTLWPEFTNFDNLVETGFQLATAQGPLCAEPIEGLAFFLETLDVDTEALEREIEQNKLSQITGSLISAVREACKNGLLDWSPRLMLAVYSCDIQATTDVLGKVHGVVAKRHGRIVAEEVKEGTSFFTVSAVLPVIESFGFADDIRKRTSGEANPQLLFSGYELLDLDPFWVPKTEEELEDLGEKADRINVAKEYMDNVRERKGMFVDRKVVEIAEKQRTLKR